MAGKPVLTESDDIIGNAAAMAAIRSFEQNSRA
jgi:hypothetical protein